jgi:hypothetical protein
MKYLHAIQIDAYFTANPKFIQQKIKKMVDS